MCVAGDEDDLKGERGTIAVGFCSLMQSFFNTFFSLGWRNKAGETQHNGWGKYGSVPEK